MPILLLIAVRIIVNPLSNVFQKKLIQDKANPLFIIFVIHFFLTLSIIPLIGVITSFNLSFEFYVYIISCSLFAVSGNFLIIKALQYSDLSILGPVNSYKSVVSMLFGIFLIQEIPGIAGLLGIILIIAGSYVIAENKKEFDKNKLLVFFKEKGIQFRITALLLTGIEAILLKKAIILSSPLITFIAWCFCGLIISGLALTFRPGKIPGEMRRLRLKKFTTFNLFITTGIMQLCTLLVFNKVQVGYSLALFQISSLVSVFLGYKFFNERDLKKRLSGTLLMVLGSTLIIIFR